jgi:hypothetical protein
MKFHKIKNEKILKRLTKNHQIKKYKKKKFKIDDII